jgi:hypothetical protein
MFIVVGKVKLEMGRGGELNAIWVWAGGTRLRGLIDSTVCLLDCMHLGKLVIFAVFLGASR